MRRDLISALDDATPFRQTLSARPSWVTHGLVILLSGLLIALVAWSAIAQAKLVVVSRGRIRPVERPTKVFFAGTANGESRVEEVLYKEGCHVKAGQVLIRVQTALIDNQIEGVELEVETLNDELLDVRRQTNLIEQRKGVEIRKANAELAAAVQEIKIANERRQAQLLSAQIEQDSAAEWLERVERLSRQNASSKHELSEARTKFQLANQKVAEAELPVDDSRLEVLQQAVELVDEEFAVRIAQSKSRLISKQGQRDSLTKKLDRLMLQRCKCELRAPIDGVVVSEAVMPGDALTPGRAVIEIARNGELQFEAFVASDDAGELRTGMPVRIKFSAFDYQQYGTLEARIQFIAPDSVVPGHAGAQAAGNANPEALTLGGMQSSQPGYRVCMKLMGSSLQRKGHHADVKLGMDGVAEIVTGEDRLLTIFTKKLRHGIRLE
ncbi:MAG: HlyD family efflux transporter periplasmic adaptor subunit [Pirellulaceae bacterium]